MTTDEFFNTYNGKALDFDGYYGYQCMDLYQQYNKEIVGAPHVPADPAHKIWTEDKYPKNFYEKIANTLEGVPQKGDVVIWSKDANGGFGHVGIFANGNVNEFTSFDQNWPMGTICHFQKHNYNHVLGWLRPRLKEQMASITQRELDAIIKARNEHWDALQVAGVRIDQLTGNLKTISSIAYGKGWVWTKLQKIKDFLKSLGV